MSLELYAKVEHLLGIEEPTQFLHEGYMELLEHHKVNKVLDVGCGRGGLLKKFKEEGIEAKGIDLSLIMVEDAKKEGLDVECKDICEVSEKFDVITSVFDVLNFLNAEELDKFLACVADALEDDGIFLADVNTLHGFKNVADGVLSVDRDVEFLNIEAIYENEVLNTTFTLFSKESDGKFSKEQSTITQYFHPLKTLKKCKHLKLVENRYINLYDEKDKMLLVFKKVS